MNVSKEKLEALRDMLRDADERKGDHLAALDDAFDMVEAMLENDLTPVKEMIRKIDTRRPETAGYVTTTPEILSIMGNLSPLVPWNVFDKGTDEFGLVSVELKTVFHLERELM